VDEFKIIVEDEKTVDVSTAIMNDFLKGEKGATNKLTVGIVEKGEEASASIVGESPNQILNLVLPKGDKGDTGEAFTYDKFTTEQLEKLRGPQGKQGIQGEQGLTGDKGDKGDDGASGYTPIKGIDYFTDNEIAEIKNNLQEEVNTQINKVNTQLTNIEQEGIIVSPTEPTENRRKVWMQKSKNFLNIKKSNHISSYDSGQITFTQNGYIRSLSSGQNGDWFYVPLNIGKTYTISYSTDAKFSNIRLYKKDKSTVLTVLDIGSDGAIKSNTFTAEEDGMYFRTWLTASDTVQSAELYWAQIEEGTTVTKYEKYLDKEKTYILNDNNVYEEFMKKEIDSTQVKHNNEGLDEIINKSIKTVYKGSAWYSSALINTKVSINAKEGGKTLLLCLSGHAGTGNNTYAGIYMIRCGYDGNNYTKTSIVEDKGQENLIRTDVSVNSDGEICYKVNHGMARVSIYELT